MQSLSKREEELISSSLSSLNSIGKQIHELFQSHGQSLTRWMSVLQLWFLQVSSN